MGDEVQAVSQGGVEGGPLDGPQGAAERGLGQGGEQAHPPLGHVHPPRLVGEAGRSGPFVERVEPGRATDAELDHLTAEGVGDDAPLPLGVAGHVHTPAEGDVPGGEALGEGRLAAPDLSGQKHVGVGESPLAVQLPRVEAEGGAGPCVLADEGAPAAEALLGEEGVGAGEHLTGGPVRGDPETAIGAARAGPGLPAARQVGGGALLEAQRRQLGLAGRHEAAAVGGFEGARRPDGLLRRSAGRDVASAAAHLATAGLAGGGPGRERGVGIVAGAGCGPQVEHQKAVRARGRAPRTNPWAWRP